MQDSSMVTTIHKLTDAYRGISHVSGYGTEDIPEFNQLSFPVLGKEVVLLTGTRIKRGKRLDTIPEIIKG